MTDARHRDGAALVSALARAAGPRQYFGPMKLRLIYVLHMLAPWALVCRHIERLDEGTALALRSLFP